MDKNLVQSLYTQPILDKIQEYSETNNLIAFLSICKLPRNNDNRRISLSQHCVATFQTLDQFKFYQPKYKFKKIKISSEILCSLDFSQQM